MTTTIAVAGKGGTGKTTIAAMVIRYLLQRGLGPVLAIDADPSSNLNLVLGLPLNDQETVGYIREEMLEQVQAAGRAGAVMAGGLPGGMTKHDYLNFHVRSIIVEGDDVDLLAMGRPEGQGCYCPANHSLRAVIDSLSAMYPYVVMDNEAGLEHLSRRTTRNVDHLLVVSDPSQRGLVAARRVAAVVSELSIEVEHMHLIVNRLLAEQIPPPLAEAIAGTGIPLIGTIPYDETLAEYETTGRPAVELDDASPVCRAMADIIDRLAIVSQQPLATSH